MNVPVLRSFPSMPAAPAPTPSSHVASTCGNLPFLCAFPTSLSSFRARSPSSSTPIPRARLAQIARRRQCVQGQRCGRTIKKKRKQKEKSALRCFRADNYAARETTPILSLLGAVADSRAHRENRVSSIAYPPLCWRARPECAVIGGALPPASVREEPPGKGDDDGRAPSPV